MKPSDKLRLDIPPEDPFRQWVNLGALAVLLAVALFNLLLELLP